MNRAQITLAIVTIVASGVVSGIVTFRLSASRDARRLRREKLEALFLAHRGFLRRLDLGWLPYIRVMDDEIDYNTALELTRASSGENKHNFETAQMLVALCFPELEAGLSEEVSVRDRAADLISAQARILRWSHYARYSDQKAIVANRRSIDTNQLRSPI